jgi:hypothetical protein
MLDKHRPVWVTGRTTKRTRRALTITTLDKQLRSRAVVIPSQYVYEVVKQAGVEQWKYKVPAWQAFQHKLEWEET